MLFVYSCNAYMFKFCIFVCTLYTCMNALYFIAIEYMTIAMYVFRLGIFKFV